MQALLAFLVYVRACALAGAGDAGYGDEVANSTASRIEPKGGARIIRSERLASRGADPGGQAPRATEVLGRAQGPVGGGRGLLEVDKFGRLASPKRGFRGTDLLSGLSLGEINHLEDASLGSGDCAYKQTFPTEGGFSHLASHDVDCGTMLLVRFRVQETTDRLYYFNYTCCAYAGAVRDCGTHSTTGAKIEMFMDLKDNSVKCPTEKGLSQFKISGGSVSFKCCKPAAPYKLGDCSGTKTSQTTLDNTGFTSWQFHNTRCKGGLAMHSFTLMKPYSNMMRMQMKRECCTIQLGVPEMGTVVKNCHGCGDPHIIVFDRTSGWNDMTAPGVHWLIKNKYVWIQSRWCNTVNADASVCSSAPAVTRDIMAGGPFLRHHRFILSPDPRKSKWDDADVSFPFVPDSIGVVGTHIGDAFTLSLPMDVQIATHQSGNWNGGRYFNWNIDAKALPGGQDGHCGTFDGNAADDSQAEVTARGYFKIADDSPDNLFHGKGSGALKAAECKGEAKIMAEATCKKSLEKDIKSPLYETFYGVCVYDVCFGEATDFASETEKEIRTYEDDLSKTTPRPYTLKFVDVDTIIFKDKNPCPEGMILATPKSKFEYKSIMAQVGDLAMNDALLLGGYWNSEEEAWLWSDKTMLNPKCTWSSFPSKLDWRERPDMDLAPEARSLCMGVATGMWFPCGLPLPTPSGFHLRSSAIPTTYMAVCHDKTQYGLLAEDGPIKARMACGEGMRMAMPKTLQEQLELFSYIHPLAGSERIWLGGRFIASAGGWFWEDGEPICGYTNWGTPGDMMGLGSSGDDEEFLCMDLMTGKWLNCGPDKTMNFQVACETKPKGRTCPKGAIKGILQGLMPNPDAKTWGQFQDFCFYFAKGGQNCEDACDEQIGGTCDPEGTQFLVDSVINCRIAHNSFGGYTHDPEKSGYYEANDTMCVYREDEALDVKQIRVLRNPSDPFTSCMDAPATTKDFRICACVT